MIVSKQLGAEYSKESTQFRVASEHAQKMDLCLFSPDEKEEIRIPMERQGDVWHAELGNIKPGKNMVIELMENTILTKVYFSIRTNWQ